jgi:hypothetical protein
MISMSSFVSGPTPCPTWRPTALLPWKKWSAKLLVDDTHTPRMVVVQGRLIAAREVATFEQGDLHGLEIAWRHGVHERLHVLAVGALWPLDRRRAVPSSPLRIETAE